MSDYYAVLMDTISIQKYVFASNKLLDNLGASQIVADLFEIMATPVLAEVCGLDLDEIKRIMGKWEEEPTQILMDQEADVPFEIGVSGGGKALLLFRQATTAEHFIKRFTAELLVKAPGLQLAIAVRDKFCLNQEHFSQGLDELYEMLAQNRNRYFPLTEIPNQGLTSICPENGTSLNTFSPEKKTYVSYGKTVKLKAGKIEEEKRQKELSARYPEYAFSNQLDQLAQSEGDSYVAVVHIDGNNMGNWFKQSNDLVDYRQRSKNMIRVTKESFWSLIDEVTEIMNELRKNKEFELKGNILPIRPIILGGDDITFVCHGKLGLYLTEKFLQIWTKSANSATGLKHFGLPVNGEFTACAGIALAKTKYPFYRTYQYAEQCCDAAKKEARRENKGSWIDFQIISGTKSGNLEKIRKEESEVHGMELYFGPYCLEHEHKKSLLGLQLGMKDFYESKYWVRSNIKELRTAFNLGQEVLGTFLTDMKAKGGELPEYKHYASTDYQLQGYSQQQTPYPDILEMMEFYPYFLLKGGEQNVSS